MILTKTMVNQPEPHARETGREFQHGKTLNHTII